MASEIIAYKCDYCNKVSRTRTGILNHEARCRYNPACRFCFTCKHFNPKGLIGSYEYGDFGKIEQFGAFCNYYNEPIIRGKDAVYYRDCETEFIDYNRPEMNIPCTCQNYEEKGGEQI